MLQFLIGTRFPFMKYRRYAYVFSGLLVLATAVMLFTRGPRYGVDFAGGTLLQIRTAQAVPADQMREALKGAGMNGVELQQLTGQDSPNEYLIRFQSEDVDPFARVQQTLQARFPGTQAELRRIETVGPKVGSDLRGKAIKAVFWSLLAILIYVGSRYKMKFAVGGIAALFHDVFVTLGFLMFTGREITLTVVAALLTIAGYSINDTIVVFDRIRERDKALAKETAREGDGHCGERDTVAHDHYRVHGVPGFVGVVHVGRRGAPGLLVRHARGRHVRHVQLRVRGERPGTRHLDLA